MSIRCIMTGEEDLQAALPMTEIKEDLIPYEALFPPVSEADEDSSSSILLEDQVANDNHNLVRQFYGMDTGTASMRKGSESSKSSSTHGSIESFCSSSPGVPYS